jgi:hypothetical protein
MSKDMRWFLVPALLVVFLAFSLPARADTIITLKAAPGTDLLNVHVGDTLNFDVFASTTDTVPEAFTSGADLHVFWDYFDGTMNLLSFKGTPTTFANFQTDPLVFVITFLTTGAGQDQVLVGWPDCTGLPTNTSGCAITNLGASRPADSFLDFTIQTPEPSTFSLLVVSLLTLATMMVFRRTRIA